MEKRVIIICLEIAGDSDIPHSGIGHEMMQVAKQNYNIK
jgi:hypothetical protein